MNTAEQYVLAVVRNCLLMERPEIKAPRLQQLMTDAREHIVVIQSSILMEATLSALAVTTALEEHAELDEIRRNIEGVLDNRISELILCTPKTRRAFIGQIHVAWICRLQVRPEPTTTVAIKRLQELCSLLGGVPFHRSLRQDILSNLDCTKRGLSAPK